MKYNSSRKWLHCLAAKVLSFSFWYRQNSLGEVMFGCEGRNLNSIPVDLFEKIQIEEPLEQLCNKIRENDIEKVTESIGDHFIDNWMNEWKYDKNNE